MTIRVGMICPYSLSLPGGVQEQVLSLARVMRGRGVDVRVLAPCDGPPPDTGITTLGSSLPTAANDSIAPIAPDLPAQVRHRTQPKVTGTDRGPRTIPAE